MASRAINSLIRYFLISMFILLLFFSLNAKAEAKTDDFFFDNLLVAANLNLKAGNVNDALDMFINAEEFKPDNAEVLIGLIRSYSELNDFTLAREKLSRLEKHHPYDMRIHLVKGEYLAMKGHIEEAAGEFTLLVEKGIYRFEALQGLIRLYSRSGDSSIKGIVESAIPMYETKNQITLYTLMANCLEQSGRNHEANETRKLLSALKESTGSSSSNNGVSEISELEIVILKAERLISESHYADAEEVLAGATHKWPANARVQDLLKTCYFRMIESVPVNSATKTEQQNLANILSEGDGSSKGLSSLIPPSATFSADVETYITDIFRITGETEKYFQKMMVSLSNLKSRINNSSSSAGSGAQSKEKQNLRELNLLMNESAKVTAMEIEALNNITPPENFIEFHNKLITVTKQLNASFKLVNHFITSKDWTSYFKVMNMLAGLDEQIEGLNKQFETAIMAEMQITQLPSNQYRSTQLRPKESE